MASVRRGTVGAQGGAPTPSRGTHAASSFSQLSVNEGLPATQNA